MIDKRVIDASYGFTIDLHGEILGLTAGDMGYEPTGIKIDGDTLKIWELGVIAWDEKCKACHNKEHEVQCNKINKRR